MDPALMSSIVAGPLLPDRSLQNLLISQAKASSHLVFVTVCYLRNLVPKGLRLTTTPQVLAPLTSEQNNFVEKSWRKILNATSSRLMKTLQSYYKNYQLEMRSRIQHQTEAILSSNDDGQGQAIFDLTTSSMEQGIAWASNCRREGKRSLTVSPQVSVLQSVGTTGREPWRGGSGGGRLRRNENNL